MSHIEHIRHTLAHLLAAAVRDLYPGAKNAIGPAIEHGFYQDFDLGQHRVTEEDLPKIEAKMRELLANWIRFDRREVTPEEAKDEFVWNEYKCELIDDFSTDGQTLTFYTAGGFIDLCRGGHVEEPAKEIKPDGFQLDRVAGAYWRGDETKPMLTRIYGLAFETKEELEAYLTQRTAARERDHRKLGKELDLFTFSDLVGPGLPLFTPKGTLLRQLIEDFVWQLMQPHGYQRVRIPHIAKIDLYKISGHYEKFSEDTFYVRSGREETAEFVLKSMNCPHHTQIYASQPRSYRDLPIRYAEVTSVYRDEYSGELQGLTRVRMITQDDAHLFCRIDQVEEEAEKLYQIVEAFYQAFDMPLRVQLSVSDPDTPEKYLGDPEKWTQAEQMLTKVIEQHTEDYVRSPGDAAFYGPKIDFIATDSIGREWQLATIQIDFNQPHRFGLRYTAEDGTEQEPVMVHRAILGSVERFLGVVIEHFAGKFPLWLSPVQVKLLPIGDRHHEYAETVRQALEAAGYRVEIDRKNETIGKKIRSAQLEHVPYMIVIGDKEVESKTVAVRSRDAGDLGVESVAQFIERLDTEKNPMK